ncbi:GntR family transcriptional regulator [Dongia sedimenti]|uniref:GntR family transcriptional regulator n=1 Tax=Dongia sedimenti TaxID=3064282 RepID=A0ABU0YQF1_9PROT|nr:GntR family transcriptional regulator [Rhodospirillaceae bacterium R-7]
MPRRRLTASEILTPEPISPMTAAEGLTLAPNPGLAERAAEAIVLGVASGALQPGQRLLEVELARLLQMSRVPLREALKILEAQGIVESAPHRGTRLATFDEARIDEICEARLALEKIAMRGAMEAYRREPALLLRLDKILTAMERAAAHMEWIEISKADLDFHREICRASGNAIVQKLWDALARHVLIVFGKEIRSERDAKAIVGQHRRLRDILAAGKAEALDEELDQHILRLQRRKGRNVR